MATGAALRYWIDLALECVRRDHTPELVANDPRGDQRGPFLSARALGLALAALHDGAVGGHLLVKPGAAPSIGLGAAACYQVLLRRFPLQSRYLRPAWTEWRARFTPSAQDEDQGRRLGDTIHELGVGDAAAAVSEPRTFPPTHGTYDPRPPPTDPNQGFHGPIWGRAAKHLMLAQHVAGFPLPPGRDQAQRAQYATDFDWVVDKGPLERADGTRTLDEELIGIFWGYDGPPQLGTPPRLYLQIVLAILDCHPGLALNDALRAIAGVAIAMADAGIEAWFYKYEPAYLMWRPAIGIPDGTNARPTPEWTPLGRPDTNRSGVGLTPNFPSYPSGHATFGAAAFHVLRLFLAEKGLAKFDAEGVDDVAFSFMSDEFNGRNVDPRTQLPRPPVTLDYPSLWKAITDNSLSRVFLGVHWQFDGVTVRDGSQDAFGVPATPAALGRTGGVWLGARIAEEIARKLGVSAQTIAASRT